MLSKKSAANIKDLHECIFIAGFEDFNIYIDFCFSKQGASFVELDVQLTKDHVPVIFHDDFVAVINGQVTSFFTR